MNMFVHKALRHFVMAEEGGGDTMLGGGGGDTSTPATTTAADDVLSQVNSTKTVGELADEQAAKDLANAEETPEAKLEREAAEAKANEVPETYADFIMPEGVEVDPAMLGEFNAVAKELGLTQAQAQKLVDLQTKAAAAGETGRGEQLQKMIEAQQNAWANEVKNDPELGGAKFDQTISTAVKAVSTFFGDDFRTLLNESGIGNHPALVRGMHKIGLALSEDKLVIPGSDSSVTENKSAAEVMFGGVFNK